MSTRYSPQLVRGSIVSPDRGGFSMEFLFNPSEITDTHTPVFASHSVPGLSHPVYQAGAGGERLISMTLYLDADIGNRRNRTGGNLRFIAPAKSVPSQEGVLVETGPTSYEYVNSVDIGDLDELSIENDLAGIRSLTYPMERTSQSGITTVFLPQVLLFLGPALTAPRNAPAVECIIKKADIRINYFGPTLAPMRAAVDIEFAEVARRRLLVDDIFTSRYVLK